MIYFDLLYYIHIWIINTTTKNSLVEYRYYHDVDIQMKLRLQIRVTYSFLMFAHTYGSTVLKENCIVIINTSSDRFGSIHNACATKKVSIYSGPLIISISIYHYMITTQIVQLIFIVIKVLYCSIYMLYMLAYICFLLMNLQIFHYYT